jgi:hypothetical protein
LESFRTERGDVLLSLQLTLAREERGIGGVHPFGREPTASRRRDRPATVVRGRHVPGPPVPRSASPNVLAPVVQPGASAELPEGPVQLIDIETGARTLWALRRDLAQSRDRSSSGPVQILTAIMLEPPSGSQPARPEAARAALRAVVDVAPFVLTGGGQVYRLDGTELAVLVASAETGWAERAHLALECAVQRLLSDRALPPVGLAMRPMAPAEIERRVFGVRDRGGPETERIAAAV